MGRAVLGRRERKECVFLGSLILGPAFTIVLGTRWTLIPCLLDGWMDEPQPNWRAWSMFIGQKESLTLAEEGEMCANRLGVGEKVPIDSRVG